MTSPLTDAKESVWRTASLPISLLLGIALPLYFLSWVDRYLYYLRPGELLPTYATAWLFLAAVSIPAWIIAALLLRISEVFGKSGARRIFTTVLEGIGAAIALVALLSSTLAWLRTFGLAWDPTIATRIVIPAALGSAVLTALSQRGRALIESLGTIASCGTAVGALTLLSLPLFGWADMSAEPATRLAPASQTTAPRNRPSIILLTIDALSADHMSLYGAARPDTPMLSAFAASATTFEHAYANGNFTTAGVASILTGTRPWTHRAVQLLSWPEAATRRDSLPALLEHHGYETAYVSTNPLAGAAKNGMAAYFDEAYPDRINGFMTCNERWSRLLKFTCPASELPLFGQVLKLIGLIQKSVNNDQFDPRLATQPGLEWLRHADPGKPVFLWVHLFPPHAPYAAPAPWLGRFDTSTAARSAADSSLMQEYLEKLVASDRVRTLEARYEESIAYVDYYAGDFLRQALALLGDNTAVIVTADHGESFSHEYGAHCGPALYEEIIHIPLLVRFAGQQHAVRRSDPVEQVDIAPTVARIAGIQPPASWEGRSLGDAETNSPVFSMNFEENPRLDKLTTGSVAVVDGHWKLIRYFGRLHYPLMPELRSALYDLASDPGELENRITANPDVAGRLDILINTQLARHGTAIGSLQSH